MLGALAAGSSRVRGFLDGRDCHATIRVMQQLGVCIDRLGANELVVHGVGLDGLAEPTQVLDCANSGTTMRLLAGLMAGQRFNSFLVGTPQLQSRPMGRVVDPLCAMGARIVGRARGKLAPLALEGSALQGQRHDLAVASAQVKSCLLLAGLYARDETVVIEPGRARDHTERMLAAMGAPLTVSAGQSRILRPDQPLTPVDFVVPGDPSSAAFLLVAAACAHGSELEVEAVDVNPTRSGLLHALKDMGGDLTVRQQREEGGEPVADIQVRGAQLRAVRCDGARIVTMIDEIPVLALAATQATGTTTIADAGELRVKETDRIATTVSELRKLGARIEARDDGMVIDGPTQLRGAEVDAHGDHRLAMALIVAGLLATGETSVRGTEVTRDSFPGFEQTLRALGAQLLEEAQ
jgi:3-phosphoshikimate 1-carboxyvinyltransferase